MCGEKYGISTNAKKQKRITPACAGKSGIRAYELFFSKDHPRMCGEKGVGIFYKLVNDGSPPHVRGKVFAFIHVAVSFQDHPRMCGEKLSPKTSISPFRGSPPHVRGKGTVFSALSFFTRITPACAGKSLGKSLP